jgi:hypothetical protein
LVRSALKSKTFKRAILPEALRQPRQVRDDDATTDEQPERHAKLD